MRMHRPDETLQVKDIDQHYWRNRHMPHVEIRSTFGSVQGYKAHSHAEFSIGVVVSGQTRLDCCGGEFVVRQGDLVLIDSGLVHSCNPVAGSPRSYHMIYLDTDWCCDRLSMFYGHGVRQFGSSGAIVTDPDLHGAYRSIINRLHQKDDLTAESGFNNLLSATLSRYCLPCEEQEEWPALAHSTKQRLLKDLAEPPRLDELEHEFGCARETVIRQFKRRYGITPMAFVANARIEKSKQLLKSGMNVVDVSTEVGFADQSQFHRTFVQYTASTPRQYQKALSIFDNKFQV